MASSCRLKLLLCIFVLLVFKQILFKTGGYKCNIVSAAEIASVYSVFMLSKHCS